MKKISKPKVKSLEVPYGSQREAVWISLRDVKEQKQEWLWNGVLPKGECVIFYGDFGVSKSSAALSLAAIVSKGGEWPVFESKKDQHSEQGSVILITGEDSIEKTIKPRLKASGANFNYIGVVQKTSDEENGEQSFDLGLDIKELETQLVARGNVKLVIVDPINGEFLGKANANSNIPVRRVLNPLIDLARKHNFCLLGLMHENKNEKAMASKRALGSVAWMAVPRLAFRITVDEQDESRRIMAVAKTNITTPKAYSFSVESAKTPTGNTVPKIVWSNETEDVNAQDIEYGDTEGKDIKRAKVWLLDQLKDGEISSTQIKTQATVDGIIASAKSRSTLDRAKKKLGIASERKGRQWFMKLPDSRMSNEAREK
jgi:putative DNA primase/helicase